MRVRVRVPVPVQVRVPVQLGVRVREQELVQKRVQVPQRHHSQERPWQGSRPRSASTDLLRFSKLRPRHCASC